MYKGEAKPLFVCFSPEEVTVTNISASPFRLNYRSLTNLDKNEPNSTARPKKKEKKKDMTDGR